MRTAIIAGAIFLAVGGYAILTAGYAMADTTCRTTCFGNTCTTRCTDY